MRRRAVETALRLSTGTGLARRGGNGYCKREPRFLRLTETGAGTARERPVHGCQHSDNVLRPRPIARAGVNSYSATDAEKRTRATATSRTKTSLRMAVPSFFRLRRADAWARGQPCGTTCILFHRSAQYRFRLPPPPPFNRDRTCQTGREWLLSRPFIDFTLKKPH